MEEENRAILHHLEARDELMIALLRSPTALEDNILETGEQQDEDPLAHRLWPCLAASSWRPPGAIHVERACVAPTIRRRDVALPRQKSRMRNTGRRSLIRGMICPSGRAPSGAERR